MIDAILDYHMDPEHCGVSKFNALLAQKLGVPMLPLERHPHVTPLISIKHAETVGSDNEPWDDVALWYQRYELFLHDDPGPAYTEALRKARRTFRAWEVGCPSTIHGNPTRGAYRVLTYGMSHKTLLPHFTQLKHRLDAEHPDYTVELSCARHHGVEESREFDNLTEMRGIFGDKLRVLGQLADDALAKELRDVDAVALYYQPALRANNTTCWAALEAGKTLYTNTDAQSPALDASAHTWERLVEMIRA